MLSWEGGGNKNHVGYISQGSLYLWHTHMTTNITANNTTNTCAFPQPKKIPNKCHTNHPVVVKPLNKQAITIWCGKFQSQKKSVQFSLPAHPFFYVVLHLFCALCMKRREVGGAASKVKFFIFLRVVCAN